MRACARRVCERGLGIWGLLGNRGAVPPLDEHVRASRATASSLCWSSPVLGLDECGYRDGEAFLPEPSRPDFARRRRSADDGVCHDANCHGDSPGRVGGTTDAHNLEDLISAILYVVVILVRCVLCSLLRGCRCGFFYDRSRADTRDDPAGALVVCAMAPWDWIVPPDEFPDGSAAVQARVFSARVRGRLRDRGHAVHETSGRLSRFSDRTALSASC